MRAGRGTLWDSGQVASGDSSASRTPARGRPARRRGDRLGGPGMGSGRRRFGLERAGALPHGPRGVAGALDPRDPDGDLGASLPRRRTGRRIASSRRPLPVPAARVRRREHDPACDALRHRARARRAAAQRRVAWATRCWRPAGRTSRTRVEYAAYDVTPLVREGGERPRRHPRRRLVRRIRRLRRQGRPARTTGATRAAVRAARRSTRTAHGEIVASDGRGAPRRGRSSTPTC